MERTLRKGHCRCLDKAIESCRFGSADLMVAVIIVVTYDAVEVTFISANIFLSVTKFYRGNAEASEWELIAAIEQTLLRFCILRDNLSERKPCERRLLSDSA